MADKNIFNKMLNQKQLNIGIYTVKITSSNGLNNIRKLVITQ